MKKMAERVENQIFVTLDAEFVDPYFFREAWLHNLAWRYHDHA